MTNKYICVNCNNIVTTQKGEPVVIPTCCKAPIYGQEFNDKEVNNGK